MKDREERLLRSLGETSVRFYLWVSALFAVVLWGAMAYLLQYRRGLIVTGMRDQVSWGLYITNFVFFIGISHAGTLISAILRVTETEWRRPITRMAEAITVFALCVGAPMVIIDLGRPERLLNIFRYGRIQSPILWDVLSVTTYLAGCILYFYIPMIPDLAILAGQARLAGWRRRVYRALSLGWTGTAAQRELLERAISVMAIVIIPLAVSVHTVVSWIFSMTLRPGWNSSIFGPYFVVGAIYSGTAAVILSMYVLRRVFRLEEYVQPVHFRNLGILLLSFSMLYLYFNINEYLTLAYKYEHLERALLDRLFWGEAAQSFWTVQALGVFIPLLLLMTVLGWPRYRQFTIPGVALASFLVVVGAWAKRYIIIIPTLSSPFLPSQGTPPEWVRYHPTWVEWSITAAAFAWFLLIYSLLSKFFPIISIWETREGETLEAQPAPVAVPAPRLWKPAPMAVILAVLLLGGAIPARAGPKKSQPRPTSLALEWQVATPEQARAVSAQEAAHEPEPARVYLFLGKLFGHISYGPRADGGEKPSAPIALTAVLRDDRAQPLAFQAVDFSLRTSFGALSFGSRPTNDQGRAQLLVRDRRYGKYPVEVTFTGDGTHQASRAEMVVDFASRPAPALPLEGVLISPYPTAAIGVPFLVFYGVMWIVFVYAFGYLILWRMRHAGRSGSLQTPSHTVPPRFEALPPLG